MFFLKNSKNFQNSLKPIKYACLFFAFIAFVLSASAGFGGSLIMVPALSLLYGSKEGIAISSILLGVNNIFKAIAYRNTIPLKKAMILIILMMIGSGIGAKWMIAAPEGIVDIAIIVALTSFFLMSVTNLNTKINIKPFDEKSYYRYLPGCFFAFSSGAASGFSGTSGPLKGIALKSLGLNRFYLIGGATIISLGGDLVKSLIFIDGGLINQDHWSIIVPAIFLMPIATYLGKRINIKIGESAYSILFWMVMLGYSIRLILV